MKINNIRNINHLQSRDSLENKKIKPVPKVKNTSAALFEKSKTEDKGHIYNITSIEQLKKDSEKTYANLIRMIEDMLRKQGKSLDLLNSNDMVKIDEATRAEAKELIGPDGSLGIEAVSDRIVDFAIAISGGDKSKLDTLIEAIDKGFKEAERILGGLPDISLKTYDRIMEKLDNWKDQ